MTLDLGEIKEATLRECITKNLNGATLNNVEDGWVCATNKNNYHISTSGTVNVTGESEKNMAVINGLTEYENCSLLKESNTKIRKVYTEENTDGTKYIAVIPNGFYYVEGKISTGLVISDALGDNKQNEAHGNQFVWVPCEATIDGEKYNTKLKYEKTDDAETKYGLASQWYANNYDGKQYQYTNEKYNSDWTDNGGNYESVVKYGGFYVARYEAGLSNEFLLQYGDTYVTSGKNTSEYIPVSKKGRHVWNLISQENAEKASKKMYNGNSYVESSLIDSYAWDTIVEWMRVNNIGTYNTSINYGNYIDSTFSINNWYVKLKKVNTSYAKVITPTIETPLASIRRSYDNVGDESPTDWYVVLSTGCTDQTMKLNISDMAGNLWEWTTETGYHGADATATPKPTKYAVLRGGSFYNYGGHRPVTYRNGDYGTSLGGDFYIGFRVVLYINKQHCPLKSGSKNLKTQR